MFIYLKVAVNINSAVNVCFETRKTVLDRELTHKLQFKSQSV